MIRSFALALLLLGAGIAPAGPPVSDVPRADLAAVETPAQARRLVRQGKLLPILIFPAELGGRDDAENRSYITPDAADARAAIIATLKRMVGEARIDRLTVEPDYRGGSIVPWRLRLEAGRHGSSAPVYQPTLDIW